MPGQGQRFRPVLALRIARLCGHESLLTLRAAAIVERMHCTSLVVDDLPCMDSAAERRNRPATQVAFGEASAQLAAFCLVALPARSILQQTCPPGALPALVRFPAKAPSACSSSIRARPSASSPPPS